jgi:hypothetical protein
VEEALDAEVEVEAPDEVEALPVHGQSPNEEEAPDAAGAVEASA